MFYIYSKGDKYLLSLFAVDFKYAIKIESQDLDFRDDSLQFWLKTLVKVASSITILLVEESAVTYAYDNIPSQSKGRFLHLEIVTHQSKSKVGP